MSTDESLSWFSDLERDEFEHLKLEFAQQIDHAIGRIGLKRREVAARMGTTPAWVTKVLRGDANPTLETMQRLADAVDCRVHLHVAPKHVFGVWTEVQQRGAANTLVNVIPPTLATHDSVQFFIDAHAFGNALTAMPRVTKNIVIGATHG